MNRTEIIIIGAGAAGLMAARELSRLGKKVTILEARDRTGGRIHTLENNGFSRYIEAGAEFIHGNLPVTLGLLKEAGIAYHSIEGEIWRNKKGKFQQEVDFMEGGDLVSARLKELTTDMTVADFLDKYFPGEQYNGLRNSVKGFVEGYDAADMKRASAFALRHEWAGDGDWEQYRIDGGYARLIQYLETQCRQAGCIFHLNMVVKKINWSQHQVDLFCADDSIFRARQVIVAIPLGILQALPETRAGISFIPALDEKFTAASQIGFGAVIKILLQFDAPFWQDRLADKKLKNLGWLFTDSQIPTWWTQLPDSTPLLTGWLAGPRAEQFKDAENITILEEALNALESIFNINREDLSSLLTAWHIVNWKADPFSLGAYAYSTVETGEAKKRINQPVENTIYFAGEALYEGGEMGTVEGALASGKEVAEKLP